MTAAKDTIDIRRMCEWKEADTKKELARVRVSPLLKKLGVGALAEDLFGEVPKTFLHDGDLRLADTSLDADGHGVFVIEGSLRVDGDFTFSAFDAYTVLVVTGDLEASRFEQLHDTQLIVMGATTVRGLLRINVDDAGFALFRGPVTTGDLEVVDNGVGSDVPMFAKKPKITARPKPPKTAKAATGVKVPSRKELETMTVDAFLALGVTGFSEVQIEGRINPNYFSKGEPGQPIEKLALMNDTYVEGFPAALAPLGSSSSCFATSSVLYPCSAPSPRSRHCAR